MTIDGATALAAMADDMPLDLADQVRGHRTRSQRRGCRNSAGIMVLFAVIALPLIALGVLAVYPDPVIDLAVSQLPPSVDRTLGDQVERSILRR